MKSCAHEKKGVAIHAGKAELCRACAEREVTKLIKRYPTQTIRYGECEECGKNAITYRYDYTARVRVTSPSHTMMCQRCYAKMLIPRVRRKA